MASTHTPSPHGNESEYEPPVRLQPLTEDEQLAKELLQKAKTSGDPLPPLAGGYNAARMGRH